MWQKVLLLASLPSPEKPPVVSLLSVTSWTCSMVLCTYIHTYNLYLYTIKDVRANKLVGSCTNKIHKITTIYRLIINTVNKKLIQELSNSYKKYNFDNNE